MSSIDPSKPRHKAFDGSRTGTRTRTIQEETITPTAADSCNSLPFNDLQSRSNAIKKVIDKRYTLMVSLNVFANQNVRRLTVLPFTARRLSRCHRRCENPVSITPLFATLTSCLQFAENTTALSSFTLGACDILSSIAFCICLTSFGVSCRRVSIPRIFISP